jgi:acyl carrier protein
MDRKFVQLIASALGISEAGLRTDSTTETVPEWTSLSHWEIIETLEETYAIELTMDEATEFHNLGELYEIVQRKLIKPAAEPERTDS